MIGYKSRDIFKDVQRLDREVRDLRKDFQRLQHQVDQLPGNRP